MAEPAKSKRATSYYRPSVSIPRNDEVSLDWLNEQTSVSFSLRWLIHRYVEEFGYTDPHATPMRSSPRRGRPPKEAPMEIEPIRVVEEVKPSRVSKPSNPVATPVSTPAVVPVPVQTRIEESRPKTSPTPTPKFVLPAPVLEPEEAIDVTATSTNPSSNIQELFASNR